MRQKLRSSQIVKEPKVSYRQIYVCLYYRKWKNEVTSQNGAKTMKNTFSLVTMAALLGLCCLAVSARGAGQNAESPRAGRQAVVVQDKFGGANPWLRRRSQWHRGDAERVRFV